MFDSCRIRYVNQAHVFAIRNGMSVADRVDLGCADVVKGTHPSIGQCVLISTIEGNGSLVVGEENLAAAMDYLLSVAPLLCPA